MRGHVVPERGRRAVLGLQIGRGEGEGTGPIVGSHRGDLRFDESPHRSLVRAHEPGRSGGGSGGGSRSRGCQG